MSQTLKWLLIILGVVIIAAVIFVVIFRRNVNLPAPVPSGAPSATIKSSSSPSPAVSATTSSGQTVKSVHCLQNPQKSTAIRVTNLSDYEIVKSPLTFSGQANAFENQFNYRLKDCRGPIISEGTVTATGEMGTMPPFSKTIEFNISRSPLDATLEVYELSAATGLETNLTQVPLRLTN